jgi:hypothetical protein
VRDRITYKFQDKEEIGGRSRGFGSLTLTLSDVTEMIPNNFTDLLVTGRDLPILHPGFDLPIK